MSDTIKLGRQALAISHPRDKEAIRRSRFGGSSISRDKKKKKNLRRPFIKRNQKYLNKKNERVKTLKDNFGFITNLASISKYSDFKIKNDSSSEEDYLEEEPLRRKNIAYNFGKISSELMHTIIPNAKVNSRRESKKKIHRLISLDSITDDSKEMESISDISRTKMNKKDKKSVPVPLPIQELAQKTSSPFQKIGKSPKVGKN
mmetsp:Transcript_31469/g.27830  ORF Transcript_31469/g.27830 Transcript_31469/m.27830 type:complete len:203 (+) Transcript_31469:202-810(+)